MGVAVAVEVIAEVDVEEVDGLVTDGVEETELVKGCFVCISVNEVLKGTAVVMTVVVFVAATVVVGATVCTMPVVILDVDLIVVDVIAVDTAVVFETAWLVGFGVGAGVGIGVGVGVGAKLEGIVGFGDDSGVGAYDTELVEDVVVFLSFG